jgi:hypothetical protein
MIETHKDGCLVLINFLLKEGTVLCTKHNKAFVNLKKNSNQFFSINTKTRPKSVCDGGKGEG